MGSRRRDRLAPASRPRHSGGARGRGHRRHAERPHHSLDRSGGLASGTAGAQRKKRERQARPDPCDSLRPDAITSRSPRPASTTTSGLDPLRLRSATPPRSLTSRFTASAPLKDSYPSSGTADVVSRRKKKSDQIGP